MKNDISRRAFIQLIAGAGAVASLAGCSSQDILARKPAAAGPRKPNILLILCDDLGWGDVQCNNPQGRIPTPNIDKLAAQGMRFTDAHGGSSVCTPTRYGVLTGRYAWRTRLQKGVLANNSAPLIASDRLTLPGMLRKHGYRTTGMGKWHLGLDVPLKNDDVILDKPLNNGPVTRGFDTFFCNDLRFFAPFLFFQDDHFVGEQLFKRTKMGAKFGAGTPLKPDDFAHILPTVCNHAIAQFNELKKEEKPFFMYFAPCAPHDPYVPTAEWKGKSGLGVYADYVMETDAEIGRLLAALDKNGLADNTLVILTSDNGCAPYAGVKQMEGKGHRVSAQFRGYKSDIWDGGHRIPFIARWPSKVKAGSTTSQTICLTDLMATCAGIVGEELPANAGEDSISILPVLNGTAPTPVRNAIVHHSINGSFSIRQGDWKLELCAGSGGWSEPKPGSNAEKNLPSVQLYNIATDPSEKENVQGENPEIVARLTALLEKYVADGRSTPGPAQKNDVAIQLRK